MSKGAAVWVISTIIVIAFALALWRQRPSFTAPGTATISTPAPAPSSPVASASASPPLTTAATPPVSTGPVLSLIEQLWNRLRSGAPEAAALADFRSRLLGSDPAQAIAAIRSFLATGRDAATGEALEVAEGGALAGAPTLRVLLLDLLGQLSAQTGGGEAAAVGREILTAKTTADEWAVSLRNVGQHDPGATAYLAGKAREMLGYEPWRSSPSAGFLESFDVPVFARDGSFVSVFTELARTGGDPVKRAASIALDRLSEANPVAVMGYLNSHPSELGDRPFLRADYYGKADLSDAQQRQAVEFYLGRADISLAEKTKLLNSLISPASFVTEGLLTTPNLRPDSPRREAAVPAVLQAWRNENRYRDLRPAIEQALVQAAR